MKGAYTVLPKYFADTDKVEDLESRLVTCMVTLQGFTPEQAKKDPFGGPGKKVPHGRAGRVRHRRSRAA